jgi:hypothetical protein
MIYMPLSMSIVIAEVVAVTGLRQVRSFSHACNTSRKYRRVRRTIMLALAVSKKVPLNMVSEIINSQRNPSAMT